MLLRSMGLTAPFKIIIGKIMSYGNMSQVTFEATITKKSRFAPDPRAPVHMRIYY